MTHGPYGGGAYGIANNLFDASTYNLGYASWLKGSDRFFDYLGAGLNISTQVALAFVTDGASADVEGAYTFYHGTDIYSAASLLNGAGLSETAATAGKIDGAFGFFMGDDLEDAMFFGNRRSPGTVMEITMRPRAFAALQDAGGVLRPIPAGAKPGGFNGNEFFLPPSAFGRFNAYVGQGHITISPANF